MLYDKTIDLISRGQNSSKRKTCCDSKHVSLSESIIYHYNDNNNTNKRLRVIDFCFYNIHYKAINYQQKLEASRQSVLTIGQTQDYSRDRP